MRRTGEREHDALGDVGRDQRGGDVQALGRGNRPAVVQFGLDRPRLDSTGTTKSGEVFERLGRAGHEYLRVSVNVKFPSGRADDLQSALAGKQGREPAPVR